MIARPSASRSQSAPSTDQVSSEGSLPERGASVDQRERPADRVGAELAVADQHQREAVRHLADERRALARLGREELQRARGRARHRRRGAGVEAGAGGVGQHQRPELWLARRGRQLGGGDKHRVTLHHRSAAYEQLARGGARRAPRGRRCGSARRTSSTSAAARSTAPASHAASAAA